MNPLQKSILADIVDSIDKSYQEFLNAGKGYEDCAPTKAGFLVAMEQVIRENPHPENEIQAALLKKIVMDQRDLLDEFLEQVEMVFAEVGLQKLGQKRPRVAPSNCGATASCMCRSC